MRYFRQFVLCGAASLFPAFVLGGSFSLGPIEGFSDFDISRNGKLAALVGGKEKERGSLTVWDTESGQQVAAVQDHSGPVTCVTFSPDNRWLVSGGADGKLNVYYAQTRAKAGSLHGKSPVRDVAFNAASNQLASAHEDGSVHVWDVNFRMEIFTCRPLGDGQGPIRCVTYAPEGNVFACGGPDGKIAVWNASARRELFQVESPIKEIRGLVFGAKGALLLGEGSGPEVAVWDVKGRKLKLVLETGEESPAAAFSSDGKTISTSGKEKTLNIWNAGDGSLVQEGLKVGTQAAGLSYLPDRKRLAVASEEGLDVMEIPTGKLPPKQKEKVGRPKTRNRMMVWGSYPASKIPESWYVRVFKSEKEPYAWTINWAAKGKRTGKIPLKLVISGDVKVEKDKEKNRNKGQQKGNKEKKVEVKVVKGRRTEVIAMMSQKPQKIRFENKGSRFVVRAETALGNRLTKVVHKGRVFIGVEGIHPFSVPFALFAEPSPPSKDVLKFVHQTQNGSGGKE